MSSSVILESRATPSSKTLFASLVAEGELLFKKRDWVRSSDALSKALEVKEDSIPCYQLRARCYLHLGLPLKALLDAERILKRDPGNYKGILYKADALFDAGNFEFASINYHRGLRVRPDVQEFKHGVQKCKEAILSCFPEEGIQPIRAAATDNASTLEIVGTVQSPVKGKLANRFIKEEDMELMKHEAKLSVRRQEETQAHREKRFLGALSADKTFLEQLRTEAIDWDNAEDLRGLAEEGINYISSRTEFWQHLKESKVRAPQPPPSRPPSARRPTTTMSTAQGTASSRPSSSGAPSSARDASADVRRPATQESDKGLSEKKKKKKKKSKSKAKGSSSTPKPEAGQVSEGDDAARPWSSPMAGMDNLEDKAHTMKIQGLRPQTAEETMHRRKRSKETPGPVSARQVTTVSNSAKAKKSYIEQTRYSLQTLENINAAIASGDYELAMTFAQSYLARLPMLNVADKPKLLANLYCSMGLCCYELGQLTIAASHQRRALEIAVRCNYRDIYLRSMEYLGLTVQRLGDYAQAISVWQTKLKFVKKTEAPFLQARISECLLNQEQYEEALETGKRALSEFDKLKLLIMAEKEEGVRDLVQDNRATKDGVIKDITKGELQCILLVATALEACGKIEEAISMYKKELQLAKEIHDRSMEVEALSHLGNVFLRAGEADKSIEYQIEASKLSSMSPRKVPGDTPKLPPPVPLR